MCHACPRHITERGYKIKRNPFRNILNRLTAVHIAHTRIVVRGFCRVVVAVRYSNKADCSAETFMRKRLGQHAFALVNYILRYNAAAYKSVNLGFGVRVGYPVA